MNNKWVEYKFGDLVFFPPKLSPPKNIEIPFIDMELVKPESRYVTNRIKKKFSGSASKFENKDVLFARITPSLENSKIAQAKINGIGFGSTEFFVFRAKEELCDQNYLYYLAKTDYIVESAINSYVGASGRQRADDKFIKRLNVKVPNPKTQRKIAAILTAYDDLIENNNKRISILENMAEQIYKEWFVRMRFPNYKNTKFVKGIPDGWEVKTLNDIADITSSKRIYANEYVEKGIPFYRSKEIIELHNYKAISTDLYISEQKHNSIMQRFGVPQEGDILITSVGTLGVSYQVNSNDKFYFKDGNLIWLKNIHPIMRIYLYQWINSESGQGALFQRAIGASQPAYTIENIKKVSILTPNKPLLISYNNILVSIKKQLSSLFEANSKLEVSRNLLLPRLLSGKLSVENLDIKFPPSMENEDA